MYCTLLNRLNDTIIIPDLCSKSSFCYKYQLLLLWTSFSRNQDILEASQQHLEIPFQEPKTSSSFARFLFTPHLSLIVSNRPLSIEYYRPIEKPRSYEIILKLAFRIPPVWEGKIESIWFFSLLHEWWVLSLANWLDFSIGECWRFITCVHSESIILCVYLDKQEDVRLG